VKPFQISFKGKDKNTYSVCIEHTDATAYGIIIIKGYAIGLRSWRLPHNRKERDAMLWEIAENLCNRMGSTDKQDIGEAKDLIEILVPTEK